MKNVLDGFKEFIMRGNVVDLAVGIIIGGAFAKVVTALTEGILTPIIAMIFGEPNLDAVGRFTLNGAHFLPGMLLTALINFLIIAAALYFFVVVPINHLQKLRKRGLIEEPEGPSEDVLLLQQIRDLLVAQNGGQGTSGHGPAGPVPPAPPVGY
ncbi:large conductance mechanosensitive channel [Sanguibacter gelidistatuariae]|uniref:Large-conductance mechanosensitive channel n=1 Tax=Sanguibacter gelidistatuariae TaxID=1814289 RepID=A0A1G6Q5Q9_9MICO|nr:large conductance mechanosensitive channel protein MscL [Sanguibacter gelidistatuariae]SDC86945.1 large conductance mechanosensitive channel [Sanguibacter gelidistatuariae]